MGDCGAFFGRRGVVGFSGPLLGVSSGVVGFNVATLSHLVREKVRPAWPDVCVSAKKFALHAQNNPKSAFLHLLGEFFAPTPPAPILDAAPRTSGWLPMGVLQH